MACVPWCQIESWRHVLGDVEGSVQFSLSVLSDALQPHGLQHTSPPCPSPTPRVYTNSGGDAIQPSHPLSSPSLCHHLLQSVPASGSFPMSQLFTPGDQSIRVSASTSVLPMNIQGWLSLVWTGWISLQTKEISRVFYNTIVQKHQFFAAQLSLESNSHIHTQLLEKP